LQLTLPPRSRPNPAQAHEENKVMSARPAADRFWEKVEKTPTCWIWTASRDPAGYGRFEGAYPHRFAYQLLVGPIPAGLDLDHACRVRHCVNPSHLEPVTHRVNVLRGISPMAINARKVICKRGHPFDETNTRRNGTRRACRKCGVLAFKRWRERHPDDARRLDRESKRQWRATQRLSTATAPTARASAIPLDGAAA
jgi:hypothetical protein